jgi:3-deoxy-D-manno-octulosonic-acid transferase
MILAYRIFTTLIYPLLLVFIILRKIFKKEDPVRYKEKIFPSHFNVNRKENSKLIWFHAASIGEFKSILPIIKELNSNSNLEFLITTITLSSSNLAKKELKKFSNVQHRFFPFDVSFLIKRFILLWKPHAIFLVDSEIWPNLILEVKKNNIFLGMINGRITLKTFKRWMLFPRTAKKIFNLFDLCLTSNLETKDYLFKLNAKNIFFNGNIKLINTIDKNNIKNLNKEILLKKRFWLASSTHSSEEFFCIQAHLKLQKKYKDVITVIAPRHINRVKKIKKICENFNLNFQILNEHERILENKQIIIINSYGVLSNYFKYANSVFIGKSTIEKLKNVGGQNPIDAAKLGCKIYHGPYVYNFKEIYQILEKNNVAKKIHTSTELAEYLIQDLRNSVKKDNKISLFINDLGKKTLADTMKNINNFLLNEIK